MIRSGRSSRRSAGTAWARPVRRWWRGWVCRIPPWPSGSSRRGRRRYQRRTRMVGTNVVALRRPTQVRQSMASCPGSNVTTRTWPSRSCGGNAPPTPRLGRRGWRKARILLTSPRSVAERWPARDFWVPYGSDSAGRCGVRLRTQGNGVPIPPRRRPLARWSGGVAEAAQVQARHPLGASWPGLAPVHERLTLPPPQARGLPVDGVCPPLPQPVLGERPGHVVQCATALLPVPEHSERLGYVHADALGMPVGRAVLGRVRLSLAGRVARHGITPSRS